MEGSEKFCQHVMLTYSALDVYTSYDVLSNAI